MWRSDFVGESFSFQNDDTDAHEAVPEAAPRKNLVEAELELRLAEAAVQAAAGVLQAPASP